MQQTGQFGQEFGVTRGLGFQLANQLLGADLLQHPLLQKRLGRGPQVQIGVQFAAQPLNIEQRFLQQHQLRLDFHMKTARGLEQTHQHHTQGDFLQRPVEIGFTDRAHRSLQLIDPGAGRHPAGLDVQLGHTFVVAPEEGHKVLRQILLVHLSQCADDAKVQRDVAAKGFGRQADLDVAGVHVGMKKAVAEHLGKKQRHPIARQLGDVHTRFAQAIHLANGHTVHALHDQDFGGAQVPPHLGDEHQVQPLHVAAQLGCTGGFAHQIQLVVQVFVELGHHLAWLQSLAICRQAFHPAGHHAHQAQVLVDDIEHARPQHLHCHLTWLALPVAQHGKVHLGDGRTGHRGVLKRIKQLGQGLAQGALDGGHRYLGRKWRYAVLQLG